MKKIGIITVSRTINFGAELQAFALQHKLNQLEYNAEVIDYLYYKNKRHIAAKDSKPEMKFGIKELIKNTLLYRYISPVIDRILPMFNSKTKQRNLNFETFHKKNTVFSREFRSIGELYGYKHKYDVFISGSDQVWNPATFSSLKPYLLDFAPKGKKRIAYAASFGVSKVSENYIDTYRSLFSKMDAIAVREESAKDLIKQITNRETEVVLDPTLLLAKSDWENISDSANIKVDQPYILIYDLHPSESLIEVTKKIKNKLGLPVYRICKRSFRNPKNEGVINIEDAGPSEFVSLFMNAKHVITNSFHGTVFSTNFNIPFHVVLNPTRKNNSRITGFLEKTGLTECIIWEDQIDKRIKTNVDFENANNVLNQLRLKSLDFIKKAIG
ncbi:MAG: polysaccharide pyruvyl transferase family protein [Draconibacterium sp.]